MLYFVSFSYTYESESKNNLFKHLSFTQVMNFDSNETANIEAQKIFDLNKSNYINLSVKLYRAEFIKEIKGP